jgi:chromosome segregation ATPase
MSEHTPLWSEERLGTRFKEILQHDILNRPLGTMRSDGQLHVQLMREVRDDYEAKLTELATLRARNEELEARIVVGESQLASCIAERDELWTGYCAAQTRAAELQAQLAAASQEWTDAEYNDIANVGKHIQLRVVIDQSEKPDGKVHIHIRQWIDGKWKHVSLATLKPDWRLQRRKETSHD